MSVIGIDEVLRRVKQDKLIVNLGTRELENPEGVGVDLRLGQVHKITTGGAYIEADSSTELGKRQGVQTETLGEFNPEAATQDFVTITPHEYYLVRTFESINVPNDLMPVIYTRGTLFKAGLVLVTSKSDPGYSGPLVFGLRNLSDHDVNLQMGARICNIVFFTIDGSVVSYRGQHQGGRVSITKEERQV